MDTNTKGISFKWISPFMKQCFVTAGVALNMLNHGTVISFPSALLPQLRETHFIEIDDSSTSWIVSIVGFGLMTGVIIIPFIIKRYGRQLINLTSAVLITLGWIIICLSKTTSTLIISRFIQGVANGFTAIIGPVLVGEYSSTKNRGAFLAVMSASLFVGVSLAHATGSFLSWQKSSLICSIISFLDIIIIIFSPESPIFLARKEKYAKCKKVFHWLKGNDEDEELIEILNSATTKHQHNDRIEYNTDCLNRIIIIAKKCVSTLKRREFYKPIIIMLHLHAINLWCGATIYDALATDILHAIVGPNVNVSLIILCMDLLTLVTNVLSIFFIRKFKRKNVLIFSVSINILSYLLIAGYSYLKTRRMLPFDCPIVGILLCNLHSASINAGCVSIPNIIAGEIFPFEYKGVGGMVCLLFFSVNLSITLNITPYLFTTIGLSGTYSVFALLVCYSLLISIIILPETKDRTLLEIENELRGKSIVRDNIELNVLVP
ncbi:uncharacterized protein LOC113517783 [Galleria mellonella]|uniref:Uncharacterized protein LOC113517783 n=1 Tax=Galleria mellonella TaxID=7137 RepID=A0A6J3BYU5_GALME|nr:uncharacterized protein LOC113517783 [Galleria mellonella]XP_031765601.2 uncharacterized protein LOC113517783 [Galleria mellonella]XP_031765602.2 uncharacterized protein LOC113517783 [Galleria mellonella]